ncbi:MAG: hypothetical protein ACLT16_12550 [[Clostridium] innocuum]
MILSVLHHTAVKEIDYLIPDTRYCSASQTTVLACRQQITYFHLFTENKLIPTPKSVHSRPARFRMSVSLNNGERVPAEW